MIAVTAVGVEYKVDDTESGSFVVLMANRSVSSEIRKSNLKGTCNDSKIRPTRSKCGYEDTEQQAQKKKTVTLRANGVIKRTRNSKSTNRGTVVALPKRVVKRTSKRMALAKLKMSKGKLSEKRPEKKVIPKKGSAKKVNMKNIRKSKDVNKERSNNMKCIVPSKNNIKEQCEPKAIQSHAPSKVQATTLPSDTRNGRSPVLRRSTRTRRIRVAESVSPEQSVRKKRTEGTKSLVEVNTEQPKCASAEMHRKGATKRVVWTPEKRKEVGEFLSRQRVLAKLKRYGLDPETATPEQIEEKRRERNRLRSRKRKRKRDPEKQRAYRKLYMQRMTPEQKQRYLAIKRAAKMRMIERRKAELMEELEKKRREYWDATYSDNERDVVEVELQKLMENLPKALTSKWNKKKTLTAEELEKHREKERERHRRMRANYTPEQRAKRLEQNRQARKRAKERGYTDEQKAARRERNRRSYRRKMEALGRSVTPRAGRRKSEDAEEGSSNFSSKVGDKSSKNFYSRGTDEEEEVRIILDDDENEDFVAADSPGSSKRHSCVIRRRKTHPTSGPDPLPPYIPTTCKIVRSLQPPIDGSSQTREGRFVTAVLRPIEGENVWYQEVYDEEQHQYRHVIEVPDDCEVLYMDYVGQQQNALL